MRRRHGLPPSGGLCATCGVLMTGRAPDTMTCSQPCTLAWLQRALGLVPHARTGEPFILGLTTEETRELCSVDGLTDDSRLRELRRKHLVAIAEGGEEAQAFVERTALTDGKFH